MILEIRPALTKDNVLSRISSLDIFKRYCENFQKIGEKFSDRDGDSKPSCIIDYYKGDLLYKDFGTVGSFRAIDYVANKYGLNFFQTLELINRDFSLGLGDDISKNIPVKPVVTNPPKLQHKSNEPTTIRVKRREWSEDSLGFWLSYGWTLELLLKARIFPISYFWITNPRKNLFNLRTKIAEDKLAYTIDYYFHKGVFRRKLYFPHQEIRFISNVDDTIVQGYPLLPKSGDLLIVTSSIKDCGPFWNLGYNAIAPNSENEFFNEQYVNKLKSRWKRIVIWFDNDFEKETNTGVKYGKYFADMYNLEYTYNPDGTAKDPSDFVYTYGLDAFKQLIDERLFHPRKRT